MGNCGTGGSNPGLSRYEYERQRNQQANQPKPDPVYQSNFLNPVYAPPCGIDMGPKEALDWRRNSNSYGDGNRGAPSPRPTLPSNQERYDGRSKRYFDYGKNEAQYNMGDVPPSQKEDAAYRTSNYEQHRNNTYETEKPPRQPSYYDNDNPNDSSPNRNQNPAPLPEFGKIEKVEKEVPEFGKLEYPNQAEQQRFSKQDRNQGFSNQGYQNDNQGGNQRNRNQGDSQSTPNPRPQYNNRPPPQEYNNRQPEQEFVEYVDAPVGQMMGNNLPGRQVGFSMDGGQQVNGQQMFSGNQAGRQMGFSLAGGQQMGAGVQDGGYPQNIGFAMGQQSNAGFQQTGFGRPSRLPAGFSGSQSVTVNEMPVNFVPQSPVRTGSSFANGQFQFANSPAQYMQQPANNFQYSY